VDGGGADAGAGTDAATSDGGEAIDAARTDAGLAPPPAAGCTCRLSARSPSPLALVALAALFFRRRSR
jgi:MYXO-CTERM domain-containing protein